MSKIFKSVILITIIVFSVSSLYILENSSKHYTSKQNQDSIVNSNTQENDAAKESAVSQNISNPSDKNNNPNANSNKKDYSVLVSSSIYNAVVSLDEDTKDINVKLLDDTLDVPKSDNYINISDEDLKYLEENADTLLNQFKEGSLIQKYSLVTNMLKDYDTDISEGDLINLAFKYIK